MAKKQKTSFPNSCNARSNALAYKNFNSSKKKHRKRKNPKRYFEHDTRIEAHKSNGVKPLHTSTAPIKKIKFNNEINIYDNKYNTATTTTTTTTSTTLNQKRPKCATATDTNPKPNGQATNEKLGQGKRTTFKRRQMSVANACIQTTTKRLQKQLLDAQKKIQKQLVALQEHQRAQNKSFLALIKSKPRTCIHATINRTSADGIRTVSPQSITNKPNSSHSNHKQSEQFCKHFVDECNCSNEYMAYGNDTMAIRAFACDPLTNTCNTSNCSTNSQHNCCPYTEYTKAADNTTTDRKKFKLKLKKPFLKSIILSTSNSSHASIVIKKEPEDNTDNIENTLAPEQPGLVANLWNPISIKPLNQPDSNEGMQLADMNKPNRDTHVKLASMRSHSSPMPKPSRTTSTVSSSSVRNKYEKRSHDSRDRKSSKKKKRRRHSHSRSSNSRSRTRSHSRARHRRQSHSNSRSNSRSRSRSRSFRRRHTRSRSSSSYSPKRHGQEQKRNSKYGEDSRRAAKKEEKTCTCVCECTSNCKRQSSVNSRVKGNSNSKRTTQSPVRDRKKQPNHNSINAEHSFNSKQSSSIFDACNNKYSRKPFAISNESKSTNGDGIGKKPIAFNSGVLLRQTPIVRLHCSPGTGSDTDDEIDERFDKKYEELLTFETNEDERREQRLLKALSDIAAKAKQKIQSISDTSNTRSTNPDKNHNTDTTTGSIPIQRPPNNEPKQLNNELDDRQLDRQSPDHDFSPNERRSSRRSRKDSSSSSSKEDESTRSSSRSPSIPRRRGSPSFLDRRRITSARKKPIPYQRSSPYDSYDEWDSS